MLNSKKSSRMAIIGGSIAIAIAMTITASGAVRAADVEHPAAKKPSIDQIQIDVEAAQYKAMEKIAKVLHGASMADVIQSKTLTAKFGPRLTPILGSMVDTLDQAMAERQQLEPFLTGARDHFLAVMAVLGDQSSLARLSAEAKSAHPFRNLLARMYLQEYKWLTHQHDAAVQRKVINALRAIAIKHPMNEDMVQLLMTIRRLGAANAHVADQAREIILKVLESPAAQQYQQQYMLQATQKAHLNHPAVLKGVLLSSGKPFSTKSLLGHVVLVDTWATWCPPCRMSIPHLESLYSKWHKKGLDIVGMSVDANPHTLLAFLAHHKKMVWPQMYDVHNPGNHAMLKAFGIFEFPTMLIIDRRGILRKIVVGFNPAKFPEDAEIKKLLAQ